MQADYGTYNFTDDDLPIARAYLQEIRLRKLILWQIRNWTMISLINILCLKMPESLNPFTFIEHDLLYDVPAESLKILLELAEDGETESALQLLKKVKNPISLRIRKQRNEDKAIQERDSSLFESSPHPDFLTRTQSSSTTESEHGSKDRSQHKKRHTIRQTVSSSSSQRSYSSSRCHCDGHGEDGEEGGHENPRRHRSHSEAPRR